MKNEKRRTREYTFLILKRGYFVTARLQKTLMKDICVYNI